MPDAIQVTLSNSYRAKRRRIQRLPKLVDGVADTLTLREANELIEIFQAGIRERSFNLEGLAPATVARKRRRGLRKPRTPLYGAGDDEARSLINALRIRKLKNGYRVAPRTARHHEAALRLKDLFEIHERGAVIRRGGKVIRIPPRPAFTLAFRRLAIRLRGRESAPEVVRAITALINDANERLFHLLQRPPAAAAGRMEGRP